MLTRPARTSASRNARLSSSPDKICPSVSRAAELDSSLPPPPSVSKELASFVSAPARSLCVSSTALGQTGCGSPARGRRNDVIVRIRLRQGKVRYHTREDGLVEVTCPAQSVSRGN